MLLRCEWIIALGPEVMMLDVVVLVLAGRYFRLGQWQIWNRCEDRVELGREFLLLRLKRRDRVLQLRVLGHQLTRRGFVFVPLRRADLLGRRVAPRLRLLGFQDRGTPLLIERYQLCGLRRQPTPLKAGVEGFGVFANPFDVVHGWLV